MADPATPAIDHQAGEEQTQAAFATATPITRKTLEDFSGLILRYSRPAILNGDADGFLGADDLDSDRASGGRMAHGVLQEIEDDPLQFALLTDDRPAKADIVKALREMPLDN